MSSSVNTPEDDGVSNREYRGIYGFIGKFVKKNTIYVFTLSLIFVGFAIYGITKTKAESNVFESFPKSSEISKSTAHIEQNLMGLLPMEIVVNAINVGSVFQPEVLDKIEKLQDYLEKIPEVTKTMSVVNYIKNLNTLLDKDKPDNQVITKDRAIDYVKLSSLHGDNIVKSLYTEDHNEGRVNVRMKNVGSTRYQEIVEDIEGSNIELITSPFTDN